MKVIHTLQDLCYAYNVADPVREMLFALQDRIDALEAQRKPLTDEEINGIAKNYALTNPTTPLHFARAVEAAHGIKEQP
jgi:hypothetical protein